MFIFSFVNTSSLIFLVTTSGHFTIKMNICINFFFWCLREFVAICSMLFADVIANAFLLFISFIVSTGNRVVYMFSYCCFLYWLHILLFWWHVVRSAICYHLHNLKNVKNTHEGVLILVKLQALACNFTKTNTPPWVFFTFLKLYKWYEIAQCTTYLLEEFGKVVLRGLRL